NEGPDQRNTLKEIDAGNEKSEMVDGFHISSAIIRIDFIKRSLFRFMQAETPHRRGAHQVFLDKGVHDSDDAANLVIAASLMKAEVFRQPEHKGEDKGQKQRNLVV